MHEALVGKLALQPRGGTEPLTRPPAPQAREGQWPCREAGAQTTCPQDAGRGRSLQRDPGQADAPGRRVLHPASRHVATRTLATLQVDVRVRLRVGWQGQSQRCPPCGTQTLPLQPFQTFLCGGSDSGRQHVSLHPLSANSPSLPQPPW